MNSKDYKAIGEIIKNIDFYQLDGLRLKPNEIIGVKRTIAKQLADQYEKEDKEYFEGLKKLDDGNFSAIQHKAYNSFNRKQFLEWCGVKE